MKKEEDNSPIEGHNYDGIHELDNPLPRWWLTIFYSTIVFAAVYYYHYEFGSGPSSDQELTQELDTLESKKQKATTDTAQPTPEDFKALLSDPETLKLGSAEFASKCMACHGDKGQGSIGPNLTDNAWIHGDGSVSAIRQIIKSGVAEKGMPPWGELIKPKLILQISAYIRSLNGTNPPGAKAPEGQVYP
jgi:cytochrome c oxidase cbb3-type subunit 3